MTRQEEYAIDMLSRAIVDSIPKTNARSDGYNLLDALNLVFIKIEEQEYAYECAQRYLKEKVDAGNSN